MPAADWTRLLAVCKEELQSHLDEVFDLARSAIENALVTVRDAIAAAHGEVGLGAVAYCILDHLRERTCTVPSSRRGLQASPIGSNTRGRVHTRGARKRCIRCRGRDSNA